jgi:fumarate reductase flavoprotein subunit
VTINTDTQVLNNEQQVIPGAFAAGEVVGGLHGGNRIGGNAVADIIVFGSLAGHQAALRAKR